MLKLTKFAQTLKSIPDHQIDNWSYIYNEGASPNWKLDALSYEEIRIELEKGTGLKRMGSLKDYIQKGMPGNGTAAWIYSVKMPGNNTVISLMKHYVSDVIDKSEYLNVYISAPAYGIVISDDTQISHWRVYDIKEAVNRIKFWVDKLK